MNIVYRTRNGVVCGGYGDLRKILDLYEQDKTLLFTIPTKKISLAKIFKIQASFIERSFSILEGNNEWIASEPGCVLEYLAGGRKHQKKQFLLAGPLRPLDAPPPSS